MERRACKISGKIVTTEQAALTAKHHGRKIRGVLLFIEAKSKYANVSVRNTIYSISLLKKTAKYVII